MLTSFTMYSDTLSVPAMLDDVWMPNLRGLPIGREGEIVAEFEVRPVPNFVQPEINKFPINLGKNVLSNTVYVQVASSPIRNGADDDYEDIYQRIGNKDDDYKPCLDPESRAILYPLDNFKWNENDFQRPLALKSTTRRLSSGILSTKILEEN